MQAAGVGEDSALEEAGGRASLRVEGGLAPAVPNPEPLRLVPLSMVSEWVRGTASKNIRSSSGLGV